MNKNNFFLDIFNNILDFNNSKVIIIFDVNGNIWFGLKDLLRMLGYTSKIKQLNTVNLGSKYTKYYYKMKVIHTNGVPLNFQKTQFLSTK